MAIEIKMITGKHLDAQTMETMERSNKNSS